MGQGFSKCVLRNLRFSKILNASCMWLFRKLLKTIVLYYLKKVNINNSSSLSLFCFQCRDFHVRFIYIISIGYTYPELSIPCVLDAFWHWHLCEDFYLVYMASEGSASALLFFDFFSNYVFFNAIPSCNGVKECKCLVLSSDDDAVLDLNFKFLYYRRIRSMVDPWNS